MPLPIPPHQPATHAFSLVELSIVLVILGLLVGGVLSGQSLIRAAELRSITTQHNNFYTAIYSFRDKYFALPGDMANATNFWGAAAAPSSCAITISTDAKTCNGDGNGKIDSPSVSNEVLRSWQHLANAGLIEGQYNGYSNSSTPAGKMGKSNWGLFYLGTQAGQWGYFNGDYNNTLSIGKVAGTQVEPILKPEEAWNIDSKIDDGSPALGKVVGTSSDGLNFCTDATGTYAAQAAVLTAKYLLTSSASECAVAFRNQF